MILNVFIKHICKIWPKLLKSSSLCRMTRWLWRKRPTRPHSELGRESLQRRWYFVLRHGRVGRCLVFRLRL